MINVNFEKLNDKFVALSVSGHADFKDLGEDIVCAGVSSIIFGALNGFNELAKDHFKIEVLDNLINVNALSNACIVDKLISFVFYQLKTVETQYPENIKINIKTI